MSTSRDKPPHWRETPEAEEIAQQLVTIVRRTLAHVTGGDMPSARRSLTADTVLQVLAGVPTDHLRRTIRAVARVQFRLADKTEVVDDVKTELEELLAFWTDGWKKPTVGTASAEQKTGDGEVHEDWVRSAASERTASTVLVVFSQARRELDRGRLREACECLDPGSLRIELGDAPANVQAITVEAAKRAIGCLTSPVPNLSEARAAIASMLSYWSRDWRFRR
jgi:hypothetical protein